MTVYGVKERDTQAPVQQFVRLELTPPERGAEFDEELFLSLEKWRERIDEREAPAWFDAAARFDAFEQMRGILQAASERGGDLMFGGLAFLKQTSVTTRGVRVTALSGSNVTAESGSNVTAESGSNVTALSGSNVSALSGSNVTGAW